MMYLTEQKTERLIKLSKKDLMIMLEPYTDDSLICIGLQMQQGYVGFFDLEQDTKHKDKYEFVLNSDCFNEWYKKDIAELKEKIGEQQATISALKGENEQLKKEHKIAIDEMITDYKNLEKENEQLKKYLKIHNESELSSIEYNLKLYEENEQLREALKNSYYEEICENCEYARYKSYVDFEGFEECDFECLKGHAFVDELNECNDFKLKIN